jgi:3-deoxy-7-phosphoheptulonate synthase
MIDCSHANSSKDYNRQPIVCHEIAEQVAAGNRDILGVMMESNLVAGTQKLIAGKPLSGLVYGQSITDGCVDWPTTHGMLTELAAAVRSRRTANQSQLAGAPTSALVK